MPKLLPLRLAAPFAALLFALSAGAASAHEYTVGKLMIGHPWSRATVPGVKVAGGYFTIMNHGDKPDRLVAVSVPFAERAEMHESSVEDGVAKMREIEGGVEVKPGETVSFAPGGKHLMFVGLKTALTKGEKVKGELTFETAGKVEVEFAVEAPGAAPAPKSGDMKGMDHSGH
ncbi:copper chaperone PCu(A)C [Chenggangzhangella methanolivorans]|uniref:Copper chaperone PCu(A)C n=1 Tax=Chenggangzhangella methanolivorans TaxID=1437009 RepID=A0A9E6RCK5_9HYPH|nr:copper chaperone PCu(A)C [Chenggangzhangella methanolivorans]QZO01365.1 copper chaperone PCu(A)C [Chenggangzhangella methanolivorans]